MMFAIVGRIYDDKYCFKNDFKEIFDELNILLFPIISENNLKKVCEMCDGLIIPGSSKDINPSYYNEKPIEGKNYEIDEFRLDKEAISVFANKNKPILGICGGLQAINVYFGGSLYQSIENHYLKGLTHKIQIEENSFLHRTYNGLDLEVNSTHYQAVKTVAPHFKVIAQGEDGIIEGIEKDNIIGVQWHPEKLRDYKFFKSFIKEYLSQ